MLTVISGINWGDEGKSRMADFLSSDSDVVVRYQGGNNAGHTVVNEKGKFVLNLLPSGIFREKVVSVMGGGMAIDLKHLAEEIDALKKHKIEITPNNLKISDRAIICMPYDIEQDYLEEMRVRKSRLVGVRRGIAQIYGDKYMRKAFTLGELKDLKKMEQRLDSVIEWKNLTLVNVYNGEPIYKKQLMAYLEKYAEKILPYVCDTGEYLRQADSDGKKIILESQLGALRDIDFGIYPYTGSFNTISAYAPIGAGIPDKKIDVSIGIMKAYSTCVGKGPFTSEYFGEKAEALRKAGGEYGVNMQTPRRVGAFDIVASAYGITVQGATEIALTKLDVLSGFSEIEVCVAYEKDGERTTKFPQAFELEEYKPVYETLKGWNCDISKCKKFDELPKEAKDYVKFIEKGVGARIKYVSVGAEREACIVID